eukprot:1176383-Prorocentrum_minimum.AAC.4
MCVASPRKLGLRPSRVESLCQHNVSIILHPGPALPCGWATVTPGADEAAPSQFGASLTGGRVTVAITG